MNANPQQAEPRDACVPKAAPGCRRALESSAVCVTLIVLLWLVLYVPGLWRPPLLDDADSVHAEAAREMMLSGDWCTLRVNGLRYLEKAPLLYWAMATSYKMFGAVDWAARLPLALGVLALLLAAYFVGRNQFDSAAGLFAALALGLSFGIYIYTRILIPDLLVALWLLLSVHCFLLTLDGPRPSRTACWGLAAASACSVLTKGLIGVVFPVAVIVLFLLLTRNLRHLWRMRLVSSAAVFFAIAAPWHILAGLRNPAQGAARGFFWFYFVNEHFLRYLNRRFPRDYDTVPLLLFWALAVLFLLPWSAYLGQALARVPHRLGEMQSLDRPGRARLLWAITAAVVLVFFSFSSRQEYYVLPALPALALLVGSWLSGEGVKSEQGAMEGSPRSGERTAFVCFVVATLTALAVATLLWLSQTVPPGSELADLLTRNPQEYALSFGHIFDLTPRALGLFRPELALVGLALFAGTLAAWRLRHHARPWLANAAWALMMLVVLQCVHSALVRFSPILSSQALSKVVAARYQPGDVVVINGAYEDASTLSFYGHLPLHLLNSRENGDLYFGSLFPDAPQVFEDDRSFARLWTGAGRVYLFTEEGEMPALVRQSGFTPVARSGGKLIVVNHP